MDDLGSYIYLLLILLVGLKGLFGRRKKESAEEQRPHVSSEQSWEERMRDLSRGLLSEDELVELKEMTIPEGPDIDSFDNKTVAAVSDIAPKEDVLQPTQVHVAPPAFSSGPLLETEDLAVEEDEFRWMSTVDDARRAFVYSEIFNRKY